MMIKYGMAAALVVAAGIAAGCSNIGEGMLTTSALPEQPRVDPACAQLVVSIDSLKRDGIAEKVEKAAHRKYKMTRADLTKAAQLNKANDEFQARCSSMPRPATAASPAAGTLDAPATKSAVPTPAAKAPAAKAPSKTG